MDHFDRHILRRLQADNRASYEAIGEAVGLSATAVRRRAGRLRKSGVIVADVSLVDPARLGITVIISVRFARESHETYEAFKRQMLDAEEVLQCYTVSGEVDFIVVAHLPDLAAYDRWVAAHLLSNDAIARSDTNIVYSRVKYQTAVPV